MTLLVGLVLLAVGAFDAALSGFRSSLGRSGLVDHREADRAGVRHGLRIFAVAALAPVTALLADLAVRGGGLAGYTDTGMLFLLLLAPFAVVVCAALLAYGVLGWRRRYLAVAVLLGPCTFLRPYWVVLAAAIAVYARGTWTVALVGLLAVGAVLVVEPIADHRYR